MTEQVKVRAQDHESYGTLTLVAFLIPFVGIIVGALYLAKPDAIDRKLGEHLVAFSAFVTIMVGVLFSVAFVIV